MHKRRHDDLFKTQNLGQIIYNMLIHFTRSFLIATATFVSFLPGCQHSSQKKPTPLNILWIVSDDLGTDLGCYGNTAVATPNLDQFAGESVRYTNFFTSAPVCSPRRSGTHYRIFQGGRLFCDQW